MTLFEKIVAREIPADIVHEDDLCLAFRDISPKAPVHILVVPKRVIPRVAESRPEDRELLGHLLFTAGQIARPEGLADSDSSSTTAPMAEKPFPISMSICSADAP